jgi:hypothetical protein
MLNMSQHFLSMFGLLNFTSLGKQCWMEVFQTFGDQSQYKLQEIIIKGHYQKVQGTYWLLQQVQMQNKDTFYSRCPKECSQRFSEWNYECQIMLALYVNQ